MKTANLWSRKEYESELMGDLLYEILFKKSLREYVVIGRDSAGNFGGAATYMPICLICE